jgi:hypothetical protein
MAEESGEVRRVNWSEIFSFTLIFKSFKLAIHPSKLALALGGILLVYGFGWLLTGIWSIGDGRVYQSEIADHVVMSDQAFEASKLNQVERRIDLAADLRRDARQERLGLSAFNAFRQQRTPRFVMAARSEALDAYTDALRKKAEAYRQEHENEAAVPFTELVEQARKDGWEATLEKAGEELDKEIKKIETLLDDLDEEVIKTVKARQDLDDEQKAAAVEAVHRAHAGAWQALGLRKQEFEADALAIRGKLIFPAIVDWELLCIRRAVGAVLDANVLGGMDFYQQLCENRSTPTLAVELPAVNAQQGSGRLVAFGPGALAPVPAEEPGLVYWVLMGCQGLLWLLSEHTLFAVLLGLFALAVLAVVMGAVTRIAALHFAREEKISAIQALRFSLLKLPNFFSAPLIPLAIIFLLGGLMVLAGLVGSIPYAGEILLGLLFFLVIIAGLLVAFLTVGLVGGVGLMYPTIAVEGSDSFDAISRSFAYVFTRPWRMLFYTAVAIAYGVLTYLFVRLFAWLALAATHMFVSWGTIGGGKILGPGADKLDAMWAQPTFDNLFGTFNWPAMQQWQPVGAVLIGIWVFLVAAAVFAYLLSYVASSSTVIYYLLRRKVDATDLGDVYVEEADEEPFVTEPQEPAEAQAPAEPPGDKTEPPAGGAEPGETPPAPPADGEKPDQGPGDQPEARQ